jgi:hypothetical protein
MPLSAKQKASRYSQIRLEESSLFKLIRNTLQTFTQLNQSLSHASAPGAEIELMRRHQFVAHRGAPHEP